MPQSIRITIWNENLHERTDPAVQAVYPDGIHAALADVFAGQADITVRTATLDEPEHGLSVETLDQTDVLIWWAHLAHRQVSDEVVARAHQRVLQGMGLIVLHSGHLAKLFQRLMGTNCTLCWREAGEREVLWVTSPAHPIAAGLPPCIILDQTEMYGEPFAVPQPDELIFISNFAGGEVFRSGCVWNRGAGKVFYFRPGHETYPIYRNPQVQQVLRNAVRYVAPQGPPVIDACPKRPIGWFR